MAEISAASQEQSAGIDQVNQTVVQMDETTQQNAALVEEATAAARAMEEQATQLADAVAIFRLDNQVAQAVSAVTARAGAEMPPMRLASRPASLAPRAATPARPPRSTPADDGNWQTF
jgi:methyl-accepting chemotaxis protein